MTNEALEHLRITIKNDWPWGISITPEDARSLIDEIDRLQARISDFEDDFRKVTSETCAPDEKHCSCVPHLRAEIQWLRVQADEREQRTNRIMLEAERHRKIADEAIERLEKIEELESCLRWYVENDDTNMTQPGNDFWIEGKHRAMRALGMEGE